ncbi:hypothetical protein T265_03959 [Opisthorchis viverrini]|uniref:Cilia- and flagella-associated protein 99 n=1 Tax=Opisthorchis viverrini TaxID=6198 RepID=A0A075AH60_OPIVI|nr:hypothetical protein T265_03959 [Opisthorchis viverrini]KER29389.1 hypothetical protein T265_03959 [Opisthorchis viverrini]
MDEIGLKGLRKILQLTSSQVAVALLKVFTSEESQIKLKEAWSHLYGEEFVENLLVKSFERWQPMLKQFSETYEASLQKKKSQSETKRTTVCRPFKLTQPLPRGIPIPWPIANMEKARPVPRSVFAQPKEFQNIEEQKKQNRERIKELCLESDAKQPSCARLSKRKKKKPEFYRSSMFKAQPVKRVNNKADVRLNTASIVREWEVYKKIEEEQEKKFCDLEAGAFDCIAYKSWRSEQEKRKISDRQALAEKLRLSSLLSRESAFHAKRKLLQEKRINASSLEEESHRLQEQLERTNKAELIKASSVAKIVKANRRGVRLAARKVQVDKRNTAKLVDYEKQRDHEKINEQLVEDRRRKASIIKRIRSEEEAWLLQKENYPKPYDPTDIPGHGLLSEMSLAELKERLFLLRQQNSITLADKINDIKCQRQTKSENITELQKLISCFRNAKTTSRKRQKNCEGGKEDLYDSHPELKDLAQLLLKRRRERQELQSAKALVKISR